MTLPARLVWGQGRQTGGGGPNPPEFWMGGLNTCQPPLILRRFF